MVFDAHIRAFEYFGGTPMRGIYDNMKTAVKKVLQGKDREWNEHFMRLCTHYRVEPVACTPARGNEKGRVERQVDISRKHFFTPMLCGESISQLNDVLMSKLNSYNANHKHPEYKDKAIDEVFAEEYPYFIKIKLAFDGYKEEDVKVSTTCLARFDRNSYSVHCSCAGQVVQCKSYAGKVVFVYNGEEVACHERRFTNGRTYYDWRHYLPILAKKPGALRNGAPFKEMVLPEVLDKVRSSLEGQINGSRDFAHILSYIPVESMEAVVAACEQAIMANTVSKDIIVNILLRGSDESSCEVDDNKEYPSIKHIPIADCSAYNSLLSEVSL